MIDIKIKSSFLGYRIIFFSKRPQKENLAYLVQYNQCESTSDFFGFRRDKSFTKIIDLTQKEDNIFQKFNKNTRYEINRAPKEGVTFQLVDNLGQFVNFYNLFAESKQISKINLRYVNNFKEYLIITKAVHNGHDLIMHAYLVDEESGRVRLLKSASLFRYERDHEKKYLTSMANRLLHYADMLFFKERSFQIYDLGGYDYEPKDDRFIGGNKFKDSFGGILLEESIYVSIPFYIYQLLSINIFKLIKCNI